MTLAFNLGGTITLSYVDDDPVTLTGTEIIGTTNLSIRELDPVQSHGLGWDHLLKLRRELLTAYTAGERSFLILTGTDSAEDLLYFIDLVRPIDTRVLVMVAMRTASFEEPRPAGLDEALEWLAEDAPSIGLCWGQAIIEGSLAEKVWKECWQFAAIEWINSLENWRVNPETNLREDMPVVPILPVGIGSTEWHAASLHHGGFDGLVVEAFASGDVHPDTSEILISLVDAGYPVILASRSRPGCVRAGFPGVAGTSHELLNRGVFGAAQLDPHRARLRLALALACEPHQDISAAFITN